MRSAAGTAWREGHFVAGDAALDLANTVYRRWPEPGADLLTDPGTLARWLVRTGLLGDEIAGAADEVSLAAARDLRGLLWQVFDARREGRPVPAEAFAGLLDATRRSRSVTVAPDGSLSATDVDGALSVLALRAVRLLLTPPAQGVRACDRCGWFFVDSSRGRRRRWCSMQTCGNQAKAARFRSSHP